MAKAEEKNHVYVRNNCGIKIKKCCASCAKKDYNAQIKRICTLTHERVEATDLCEHWGMHDGLINMGRRKGVVRDIDTKKVIIF